MKDPRINFRSREVAAILAFLIPGAGHFYQGRRFKAGIYFSGILLIFFAGMILGDWQPVYSQVVYPTRAGSVQMHPREATPQATWSIGYAAQFMVGLPAIPSLIQQSRFRSDEGAIHRLQESVNSDFHGVMGAKNVVIPVTGHLELEPGELGSAVGRFVGQRRDGSVVEVPISGSIDLGKKVFGSPRREIVLSGLSDVQVDGMEVYELRGSISRPVKDWYQAPRDNAELDRLHGSLSQSFDIACVFTWIAGLLNLMAIWDAYDGPGYGYGDEEPDEDDLPEGNSPD